MAEQETWEERLNRQIAAYHEAAMVYAAVTARIPDLLNLGGRTPEMLASELGLQAEPLRRFLRGLATMGVCEELEDGRFVLTASGKALAVGSHSTLRHKAQVVVGQYWLPWLSLTHCLETGEPSFPFAFGMTLRDWRANDKNEREPFYHYLAKEEMANADDLMGAFDEFDAGSMASIGGGYGGFLIPFLYGFPDLKVTVFDAPVVVEGAEAMFQAFGLQHRVTFVAGDILTSIPVKVDMYVLKGVLHNWGDPDAAAILKNCAAAMPEGATLLIVERMMPEKPAEDAAAVMLDLHMMVVTGGRVRSRADIEALVQQAGLRLTDVRQTLSGLSVLTAAR